MPKLLHLIVACSENRVIGRNGRLPWHIPEDLAFFHAETAGAICVLGRICFETWPRATLDGRKPIVLARRQPVRVRESDPGEVRTSGSPLSEPIIVRSLTEGLATADRIPGKIFICGGERIYAETLALSRPMRLHLTLIHAEIAGDTYFPEWRHLAWREVDRRESADANFRYTFLTLDKDGGREPGTE